MTQWKDITWYEWLYQIWTNWEIKSLKKPEKILLWWKCRWWYRCATLCNNWIREQLKHHRLVAIEFIENPDNLPVVMHLDNNPVNNNVNNLKWGTHKENSRQCWDEWRAKSPCYWKWKRRELHNLSKIVYQYTLEHKFVNKFDSVKSAAESFCIAPQNISSCCTGKQKSSAWYLWSYKLIIQ